ncbi:MAG: UDP-N-acetylmuramoyl-L-alanyl-D-glutamate--2,6-diaminopimelate ligase [Hyphomicrobiaceae bacterium]
MATVLTSLLDRDVTNPADAASVTITGITADSRQVLPGFLFAALAGTKSDGAKFVTDAIAKGAAAVLVGEKTDLNISGNVPVLRAAEPRLALARIAARFYGPGPETIVAVTGTSGKTSVAEFTRQIFAVLGYRAASLGTIGVVKPGGAVYGSLTTPDPVTLAATLAGLRAEGITHLAMEASSHGLDQYRLDGVKLKAGAFTNLGRDHMDYHPTVEHYFNAKLALFTRLLQPGDSAVINADDSWGAKVIAAAIKRNLPFLTVGSEGETLRLLKITPQGFGQQLELAVDGHTYTVNLPLVGTYQASNALVAAGLAIAAGAKPTAVIAALPKLQGVKGRLEIIGKARGGLGVVDYAHKPEALAAALDALRPFAPGKLICVFGCGGDRDKGKRPLMGSISVAKADVTIITDDNPRTEVPAAIRAEILANAKAAREIGDRAEAIKAAVAMLGPGDVVLVAGKGHEVGQIVGNTVLPFSDHDVLAAALKAAEHGA